ncbi:aminotransferase [Altererythrobacter salegens]|uniref:Aminotransferase n=2 Tax=Croceibacterium salegens TaxID=1737568 RepID=A0A6I4SXI0_9SPHN|nr:aminotransferase [Croceibacterium salegens]
MINRMPSWPSFTCEEADAVRAVIASNKVNYWGGEIGRAFEREFAEWSGSGYAVALANGTLALDLALNALGIGAGDEVVVTPRTFIASVSSVVNAGATPIFADVDRDSGNISPATIAPVLTERTRAIVPVHLGGWPCDMDGIMDLARARGIAVIEDCAQAHGARVGTRSVGSIGDVGAWSFCQDKIMTTGGEGGMATTDNEELWRKMWSYKDHGKDWDAVYNRAHPPGYRFVHESFGTNWRMLEMQAAIGRIQLRRMADWTRRRTENAMTIAAAIRRHPDIVRLPLPDKGFTHAFYRLYAYIRTEALAPGWTRDRLVDELLQFEIPVMHGTCSEVYLEKAFDGTPWQPVQRLPVARELGETSIMFLVHPTLEVEHVGRIAAGVEEVFGRAVA